MVINNENYNDKTLDELIILSNDEISFEEKIKIFDEILIRKPNDILLMNAILNFYLIIKNID